MSKDYKDYAEAIAYLIVSVFYLYVAFTGFRIANLLIRYLEILIKKG